MLRLLVSFWVSVQAFLQSTPTKHRPLSTAGPQHRGAVVERSIVLIGTFISMSCPGFPQTHGLFWQNELERSFPSKKPTRSKHRSGQTRSCFPRELHERTLLDSPSKQPAVLSCTAHVTRTRTQRRSGRRSTPLTVHSLGVEPTKHDLTRRHKRAMFAPSLTFSNSPPPVNGWTCCRQQQRHASSPSIL